MSVEGETLRFVSESNGYDGPEEVIVVPVGEHVYLVAPEDMEALAGIVHAGGEPSRLDFFLRDDG